MASVILLANVGNSDLQLDRSLLPEKKDPKYWMPRRLGEEIVANFKQYRDHITLPLLTPTFEYIFQNTSPDDLQILFFCSDQNRDFTNETEWLKDTKPIADAIQLYLDYVHKIPKKRVKIRTIEGSPADYSNMFNFYREQLPNIKQYLNDDIQVILEVSGGTPAMASMLITMGVETFGHTVMTLYVDRSSSHAYDIGIARVLFAKKTQETLRQQISMHAYAVAYQTIIDSAVPALTNSQQKNLVSHLLLYADRRLAFDYQRAIAELQSAHTLSRGDAQARIKYWMQELNTASTQMRLAELYHSANIKLFWRDFADFTQRLFRFQEAALRYMAEQMGIEYGKKGNQYLSQSWLAQQHELMKWLAAYERSQSGMFEGNKQPVDTERSLNRYSLGAIVDFYVQDSQWQHLHSATERLHELSGVADLRNKSVAGHAFQGIGEQDIEAAYGDNVDKLMRNLEHVYSDIFEQDLPENPYETINQICIELIEEGA